MSLDNKDIENIAKLARLKLSESELEKSASSLNTIFGLVEQLQAVDTSAVEPLAHPLELTARFRADEVSETNQRDKFQQIAPATEEGHYLVPKVIE